MATPLLLVENLLSTTQFPLHTVEADEEASGHEIYHVANGRRSPLDFWTATTADASHTITITCDTARAVDTIFIDRGHNLAGVAGFKVEHSTDDITYTPVFSITIPAATSSTDLTSTNGVTTEEGAWGKTWTPATATVYHRITIPALGTGIVPVITGLWLGTSYQPDYFFSPWDEDQNDLLSDTVVSPYGWRGTGVVKDIKAGDFGVQLASTSAYTTARYHLRTLYGRRRPMWICYDQSQADRSFLAIRPEGSHLSIGIQGGTRWPRSARIPYVEHEPA